MSTSASFRAFIPALTFFFAIVVRVGESAPRGASSSSRIRARRAMVPLAMVPRASIDDVDSKRSTTRRSIRKSIDDASIYFSTTRTSIDRATDRPRGRDAFDSIRFDRRSSTRRRDASTTSDVASTDDDDRRSSERRDLDGRDANGREAMTTTTTTTTTRSVGIIGRARATDALARRPRATRERVARRAGGVMVRAMRWRRAREDANAFDGSTRARRARESRMRRFGWTDRTRTRRDERGDAMMGRARAFDETMD